MLLACASLTVPAVIVVRRALGEHVDLYVLVGASAAMFALVLLRMSGIVRRHEVLTAREAGLRIELAERSVQRRSEERLASLIKNSSDVVCVLGADGRVQYVSDSLDRALWGSMRTGSTASSCSRSCTPRTRARLRR